MEITSTGNEPSPRVVLDTNVLIAASYNSTSSSRRLIDACLRGELIAVLSTALRREYEFIISRAVRKPDYEEALRKLLDRAEVVEPAEAPRVVPDDPEDDKLIAAALASGAVLVSNDRHLLGVNGHEGLRVLTPSVAVRELLPGPDQGPHPRPT